MELEDLCSEPAACRRWKVGIRKLVEFEEAWREDSIILGTGWRHFIMGIKLVNT